jgi:DNA-binding NtrC family response regulator
VRELRNLVVQCAATSGQVIHPEDIPAEYSESQPQSRSSTLADAARSWATRLDSDDANATLGDAMQIVESEIILSVVEACHGNKAEAARRLGIHRETLREKLKALNQQQ